MDSNNDGEIDENDDESKSEPPSMENPGKIVFVPHSSEDKPILAEVMISIPAAEGFWSLDYKRADNPSVPRLTIHWNKDREEQSVPVRHGSTMGCQDEDRSTVQFGELYCVDDETEFRLWIEAVGMSPEAAAELLTVSWHRPDEDSSCPMITTSDATRVTCAKLEVHDLRHWGPQAPLNDSAPPRIANPDLDSTTITPAPEPPVPDTLVGGAITDGASICLVRIQPPVHGVNGLTVRIRRMDGTTVVATAPGVVGTMNAVPRPYNPILNMGAWSASPPTLPLLPTPHPLPGDASSSADFGTGLAFFVPPEAYTDPTVSSSAETLSPYEITDVQFQVSLGNNVAVHEREFVLRRPPLLLGHGLNSSPATWDPAIWNTTVSATKLYTLDYSASNKKGYDYNFLKLHDAYVSICNKYREGLLGPRVAISRIDYLGHSMGGVLAMLYASNINDLNQSRFVAFSNKWGDAQNAISISRSEEQRYLNEANWHAGSFRRILTVGSPLQGSPLADLGTDVEMAKRAPGQTETFLRGTARGIRNAHAAFQMRGMMRGGLTVTVPTKPTPQQVLDTAIQLAIDEGLNFNGPDFPDALIDLKPASAMQSAILNSDYPQGHRSISWRALVGIAAYDSTQISGIETFVYGTVLGVTANLAGRFSGKLQSAITTVDGTKGDLVVSITSQQNFAHPPEAANASFFDKTIHVKPPPLFPSNYAGETYSADIRDYVMLMIGVQLSEHTWKGSP